MDDLEAMPQEAWLIDRRWGGNANEVRQRALSAGQRAPGRRALEHDTLSRDVTRSVSQTSEGGVGGRGGGGEGRGRGGLGRSPALRAGKDWALL